MSKLEDNLNEILGVEKNDVDVEDFKAPTVRKEDKDKDDIDNDYVNSRENYYDLIEKGQKAIDGILDIAKEGQHPRAYEVAGQLIKSVGDTTDKLIDLQSKMKELNKEEKDSPKTVNNALFVGSTSELSKLLKNGVLNNKVEKEEE